MVGAWGLKTRLDMLKFRGKKWKVNSHRECNLRLLACVNTSELWPPENHQASQSSICTTQGVLNIAHPLGSTCSNMAAAYYPTVWWSVISAIIDAHLFKWTKLEVLRFILTRRKWLMHWTVAQGALLIGRQFEEICNKDAFNTVERKLIQNAVLRHGGQCNGDDDIDMEGGV